MSNFSSDDLTFSAQFGGSEMREQYPGMSYRDFWGDEYLWTALLPMAWKLCSTNGRLKPPGEDFQKAVSWWSVPIHLLGLGMGWTNIALGIQQWRHQKFPDDNPILRFIKDSYGTSIEALEAFLVTRDSFNYEIVETLKLHGYQEFSVDDNLTVDQYSDLELGDDKWYLETASRSYEFGPRWNMAKFLLNNDGDPLHLSMHTLNSLAFDETPIHDESELDDPKVLFQTKVRIGVEIPAYKGFPYRLIEAMGMHGEEHDQSPIVSLFIKSLGHIGDFQHSPVTGRFFMVGDQDTRMSDPHQLHLLGNSV